MKDSAIDTVMTGYPAGPGKKGSEGSYNDNPAIGPAGVDGGIPLKFTDGSLSTKGTAPIETTMVSGVAKK